jgi:hypothetical protein
MPRGADGVYQATGGSATAPTGSAWTSSDKSADSEKGESR